jgi:Rrf2 family protein
VKISAKTDYACIAVLELAKQFEDAQPVSISTISERHGISETFLVHIMKDLKNADVVESTRGAKGGYRLSRSPEQISVAEVIQAIQGPMVDVKCMHPPGVEGCELESTCELKSVWDLVKLRIVSVLEEMTFEEVKRLSEVFHGDREAGSDTAVSVAEEALQES